MCGILQRPNWNEVFLCEVAGGQNGTGTDFFPNNLVFHVTIIPLMLHNHSIYHRHNITSITHSVVK